MSAPVDGWNFRASEIERHAQAEKELLAPDGPFDVVRERVLGVETPVFRDRLPSLRSFVEGSIHFGDAEFIVCEDRRITFAEHHSVSRREIIRLGYGTCGRAAAARRPV